MPLRPIISSGRYPRIVSHARADLHQKAPGIADQDQVLRGLEDATALLERGGLRIGLVDGPRKGARQHAGLAGGIDGNGGRAGWPMPSTAAVSRRIGRVSERATITASTAAHSIATRPTISDVLRIAAAGARKTLFGTRSMMPTHCLPASSVGASAMPPGAPAASGATREELCVLPTASAK